jgi:hypothetical protein
MFLTIQKVISTPNGVWLLIFGFVWQVVVAWTLCVEFQLMQFLHDLIFLILVMHGLLKKILKGNLVGLG